MPRTMLDEEPPIDLILAVILERKLKKHKTYSELAKGANITPQYLRKLAAEKHTNDWPPDIRNSVCRQLRIGVKSTLSMLEVEENRTGVRLH